MFKSLKEQLREARRESEALRAELNRAKSVLDYTTMMTGTELEESVEDEV